MDKVILLSETYGVIPNPDTGVYSITQISTGLIYIGGAKRSIRNRFSWHKTKIKHNQHQTLHGKLEDFVFRVLEICKPEMVRDREMALWEEIGANVGRPVSGFKISEKDKISMREGRARYLRTNPNAHELLSNKAKLQHSNDKFGVKTWINGPDFVKITKKNMENGLADRLRKHIASQSSEEMSRRSYMRKIFQ